jgi:hypothetical protein
MEDNQCIVDKYQTGETVDNHISNIPQPNSQNFDSNLTQNLNPSSFIIPIKITNNSSSGLQLEREINKEDSSNSQSLKTKNSKINFKCNFINCNKNYSSRTRLQIHKRTHVC